jgi:ornithine cyclodeaminase/alanine dehydrogenase-like protein (mu-crystallin family)
MARLLTRADVEDLIDFPGAVSILEQAFRDQAEGGVVPWPPSLMHSGKSLLILRSGGLPAQERMGVRVTTGPHNPSYALIYESNGGRLLSIVEYPFSDLRLFATVALGVDRLAKPEARRVGIIGTGRLAPGLLKAVCSVRKIDSVNVYSRTPEHRARFATDMGPALGVTVMASDAAEQAVGGADIVLVITSSETAVLDGSWVAPGALVTAAGVRSELDEAVFERAELIVTTSKVQEMNVHEMDDSWPLVRLTRSGKLSWDAVIELGEVVTGRVSRPAGICVFREAQGGFGDIALAAWAYERAVALGRGTDWTTD